MVHIVIVNHVIDVSILLQHFATKISVLQYTLYSVCKAFKVKQQNGPDRNY